MNKRGKSLLITGIVSVFLVLALSMTLFSGSSNNTKEYDSETATFRIADENNNTLIQAKRTTPNPNPVIRSLSIDKEQWRPVVCYKILNLNYELTKESLFTGQEFYDLKKGEPSESTKISRDYEWRYAKNIPYEVANFETTCNLVIGENGTETQECSTFQNGTKTLYKKKYYVLNDLSEIETGDEFCLFTYVISDEHGEQVPEFAGVKISEDSEWTEGLSLGLIHYYQLNETTGTNVADIRGGEIGGQYNGTTRTSTQWRSGLIGNALYGGTDGVFAPSSMANVPAVNFTINLWINITSSNAWQGIMGNGTNDEFLIACWTGAGCRAYIDAGAQTTYSTSFTSNTWQMITFMGNDTGIYVYLNGTIGQLGAEKVATYIGGWGGWQFGDYGSNEAPITGTYDEIGIWNRTLTQSELTDLYNNGSGITYTKNYNMPPTIPVLLSPANNSGFAMNSAITFIWNNSEDYESSTVTYDLEIYNESDMVASHLIHSNTSITEGTQNISINIQLSDYTTQDDDYYWRVRAYDQANYSNWSTARHFQYANWTITFEMIDAETSLNLTSQTKIYCYDALNNEYWNTLDQAGDDVPSPWTANKEFVAMENYSCTFEVTGGNYYLKTQNFTSDNNKRVSVILSQKQSLTTEEHIWLEWLYNCWSSGSCKELLENINETSVNIWQRLTGTNTNVVTQEDIISSTLDASHNISINYTINVPYKEGVAVNELLPIRVYFWFTDVNRTTCYNQDKGDGTNRAEAPYCLPLVAETLGPNNGSVTFQVDLKPALSAGTYNFTRSIEIDPVGVWTQYGREDLGSIKVLKDSNQAKISLIENTKIFARPGVTGAVISALFQGNLVIIIAMLCITFIVFVIVTSRTIIKVKGIKN